MAFDFDIYTRLPIYYRFISFAILIKAGSADDIISLPRKQFLTVKEKT